MKWVLGAACALLMVVPIGVAAGRQAPQKVTYDTFCSLPDEAKRAAFNTATPEEKAAVMKTHVERWRGANKSRLSAPQLALLDQMVAVITPESYTPGPGREAAQNRMRALEPKLAELFSPDDIQAAMQPSGPCLPKGK